MPDKNETYLIHKNGWTFRLRPPQFDNGKTAKALILIHGWTGDENSMWVFARNFAPEFCILAPRGPLATDIGGYGWVEANFHHPSTFAEFEPVAAKLLETLDPLLLSLGVPPAPLNLMGFSQGTAMAYTLAIQYPQRVSRIAGLSGFLPAGADAYLKPGSFSQKQVFIAHGSQDETIPVQWARETAQKLKQAGAQVTYCEEGTGHKLSLTCFTALRTFFQ